MQSVVILRLQLRQNPNRTSPLLRGRLLSRRSLQQSKCKSKTPRSTGRFCIDRRFGPWQRWSMAQKDFQAWHAVKSGIDRRERSLDFQEQEIWWCSVGLNVGSEEDGKNETFERPVLVFRKFNRELFWGFPMTSRLKGGIFHHAFPLHGVTRTVILSQIRTFSSKRLIRRIGKISDNELERLEQAWKRLVKETDPHDASRRSSGA